MVIVIVIIIAVLVVGSCFQSGILYVWVTSLADTEDMATTLRLNFKDGNDDKTEDGAYFMVGESLLIAEQSGGDPIDWSQLTVYCEVKDSGVRNVLRVEAINGQSYSPSNSDSKTGEIISLGVSQNGDFSNGDYVIVSVVEGDSKVYSSTTIRVV